MATRGAGRCGPRIIRLFSSATRFFGLYFGRHSCCTFAGARRPADSLSAVVVLFVERLSLCVNTGEHTNAEVLLPDALQGKAFRCEVEPWSIGAARSEASNVLGTIGEQQSPLTIWPPLCVNL